MYWIAVGPYLNWIEVVEMLPDVYRTVWISDVEAVSCITDPRCIAREHYVPPIDAEDLSLGVPDEERGVIPLWALTVVDYWGARPKEVSNNDHWWGLTDEGEWSYHPLGREWIATPWPLPGGHVHLPYSIEKTCLALHHTPHDKRNDSVLIYAKRTGYFDYHYVSSRSFWTQLATDRSGHPFDLLTTAQEEVNHPMPAGLTTLPLQSRADYDTLVGSVKALLGVGAPYQSPSVYSALCQGTPVIVPYFLESSRQDGWFLYSSNAQHGPAAAIGEPYVYTYYAQSYTSLFTAVQRAVTTPIERYIPNDMRYEFALTQLKLYLDRDSKAMFERVVNRDGGIPPMQAGIRERCYELQRCRPTLAPGRRPRRPANTLYTDES